MSITRRLVLDALLEPETPPVAQAAFSIGDPAGYIVDELQIVYIRIVRTVRVDQVCDIDWAVINASVTPSAGTERFQIGESEKVIGVTADDVVTTELGTLELANPTYVSGPIGAPILGSPSVVSFRVVSGSDAITAFPLSRNMFGATVQNEIYKLTEPTGVIYTYACVAHAVEPQMLGWEDSAGRAIEINQFIDIHNRNPLLFLPLHGPPWVNVPGLKFQSYLYEARVGVVFQNTDYRNTLLFRQQNEAGYYIQGNSEAATTNTSKQAAVSPALNATMIGVEADHAADILTGTGQLSDGLNVSHFAAMFRDGTPYLNPKAGAKLLTPDFNGTVTTIHNRYANNAPRRVRLSTDINLPVNGTPMSEDGTYEYISSVSKNIFWYPSNRIGFLGQHIIGFKNNAIDASVPVGKCDVYLKAFTAQAASQISVQVGWLWNTNNHSSGTTSVDWARDGVRPSNEVASAEDFWPLFLSYLDQCGTETSSRAGAPANCNFRGWNGVSGSHIVKWASGWPATFGGQYQGDLVTCESTGEAFNLIPNSTTVGYGYNVTAVNRLKGLCLIGYGRQFIRPNPGGFVSDKPRGVAYEFRAYGNDYTDQTEIDNELHEFWVFLIRAEPGSNLYQSTIRSNEGDPVVPEVCFLDLNTNWVTPDPLFDYDDAGGAALPLGPKGNATLASGHVGDFRDNGRELYARRYGDFLVLGNLAEFPAGYGTYYNPSGYPGGFTPRTQDTFTAADFASLVTGGMISSGENWRRIDFSTYKNMLATNYLRATAPTFWTSSHFYGPQQPHPADDDGPYDVATAGWMLRGPTKNNGNSLYNDASYSLTRSFGLGPFQCIWLEKF